MISRTYNTLGRLTYDKYREVVNEYPILNLFFQRYITTYDDDQTTFRLQSLGRIEFLEIPDLESKYELIYQFGQIHYLEGELIIKEGGSLHSIIVLEHGTIEVYT